ncbi:unnamed protein product [Blepharisma stoltei]|uniref:Uncharacterized protein n=1 Tax=Blepharisma stoltei TaxID=1481888 RepID=A0AAU9ID08_9CILI|nr:unnamed protein product [Blepharisma stoltei]
MNFPHLPQGNPTDLLYFDSWESKKWLSILYYFTLVGIWMGTIFLTVECSIKGGNFGLTVGIIFSIFILVFGVLFVRACLETMLSVDVIRQSFEKGGGAVKNMHQDLEAEESLLQNEKESDENEEEEGSEKGEEESNEEEEEESENETEKSEDEF